jgi:hypothetical protein
MQKGKAINAADAGGPRPRQRLSSFTDLYSSMAFVTEINLNARDAGEGEAPYLSCCWARRVCDVVPARRDGIAGAAPEDADMFDGLKPFQRDLVELVRGRARNGIPTLIALDTAWRSLRGIPGGSFGQASIIICGVVAVD